MIYQSPEAPSILLSDSSTNPPWGEDPLKGPKLTDQQVYDSWTDFQNHYTASEVIWGCVLVIGITVVNATVLGVVAKSRELWKPRHLWMACLCVTDFGVGAHKALELLLLAWPQRELCVVRRTTLGIPYVVNMLLLTILSLDRFVAVVYPFFYSATISNKHVFVGFLLVLLTGTALAGASVGLGMQDDVCRPQSLQLVYLTVVLTICSILTLLFNSSVLRIAKKQLHAIYSEPLMSSRRRVSLMCTKCGHRNATFVNTLSPPTTVENFHETPQTTVTREADIPQAVPSLITMPITLPLKIPHPEPIIYQLTHDDPSKLSHVGTSSLNMDSLHFNFGENSDCQSVNEDYSGLQQLFRTTSLPALTESIALIVPPDPIVPVTAINMNSSALDLMDNVVQLNSACTNLQTPGIPNSAIAVSLPRSRSFTCAKKVSTVEMPRSKHHTVLRSLHFGRSHVFHVGRLFPSIRFARTVLLIMIPMWVFILPIITIIPLHRGCSEDSKSDLNCEIVNKLWAYLLVHIRSVLPLQAIIDTLIYAFGSKEFRQAFKRLSEWNRQRKRFRAYSKNIVNNVMKTDS